MKRFVSLLASITFIFMLFASCSANNDNTNTNINNIDITALMERMDALEEENENLKKELYNSTSDTSVTVISSTQTSVLSEQPSIPITTPKYLTDIRYSEVRVGDGDNSLVKISGSVTDNDKNNYSNGIILFTNYYEYNYAGSGGGEIKDDPDYALIAVDYPLESRYSTLTGKALLPVSISDPEIKGFGSSRYSSDGDNSKAVDVLFYGDGQLLYSVKTLTRTSPADFSIDMRNVETLTIKVVGMFGGFADFNYNYTALTDLELYE